MGTGPSLVCPHKSDSFTKADTLKGNGKLSQKVGLLTADEAAVAGFIVGKGTNSNYLHTNSYYWLGSPTMFNSTFLYATGFFVYSPGDVNNTRVQNVRGVRAVVSLLSTVLPSTGNGTWNNPYMVN